jgi:hypothetical protein
MLSAPNNCKPSSISSFNSIHQDSRQIAQSFQRCDNNRGNNLINGISYESNRHQFFFTHQVDNFNVSNYDVLCVFAIGFSEIMILPNSILIFVY